ncbi:expressed unknown protein [Seminavis robusta]|uniref:DUF6824 domain-containing protein n=1 Tax=Seminavis robusta TaxID=568900 RepID=A0A9N8HKG9_9STRA|nr:expressed unknown protein [Seminavis robusta]|eukprot:Sro616_g175910.1 n/a (265) ;mRNA; f:9154-10032
MANWFDNKTQAPMGWAQRLLLEQELKIRSPQNIPLAASRRVYSPLAASRRVYSPLAHLHNSGSQSPQLSPALMNKTLAQLETQAQDSRLHKLATVATSTSLALDLARKQKLRYQQQQELHQRQVQIQEQNSNCITEPSNIDVLLGRGGRSNHHVGNERFRELIRSNRPRYNDLPKHEKIKLSRAVVATIHELGGRFLEPAKDGKYYVVAPNKRAVEKTSQCLREKRADGPQKSISAAAMKAAAAIKMAAPRPTLELVRTTSGAA